MRAARELDRPEFSRADIAERLGVRRQDMKESFKAARKAGRVKKSRRDDEGTNDFHPRRRRRQRRRGVGSRYSREGGRRGVVLQFRGRWRARPRFAERSRGRFRIAPSRSSSGTASRVPSTRARPHADASAPRGRSATFCAPPASSGWAAPTCCGEIDVDDLDGVIALLGRWQRAAARPRHSGCASARRRCAPPGSIAAPSPPPPSCAHAAHATPSAATRRPSATTTTSRTSSSRSSWTRR